MQCSTNYWAIKPAGSWSHCKFDTDTCTCRSRRYKWTYERSCIFELPRKIWRHDTVDHHSDIHNLSSCEINAWKKISVSYTCRYTCTIHKCIYIFFSRLVINWTSGAHLAKNLVLMPFLASKMSIFIVSDWCRLCIPSCLSCTNFLKWNCMYMYSGKHFYLVKPSCSLCMQGLTSKRLAWKG